MHISSVAYVSQFRVNPLSPSIWLFLKFWSNSPPWCWSSRRSNSPFERGSQNANYNQRLAEKRPEKKHLFRHLILTTNCLLCFWENVVKFWDLVVFNIYNIPSAYTLRLLNESGFKSFNISRTKWVFCKWCGQYIYPWFVHFSVSIVNVLLSKDAINSN